MSYHSVLSENDALLTGTAEKRIKPVYRRLLVDYDTPLSIYQKLADEPYSYLLESVQGGERWGRYSIIGLPCHSRIELWDHELRWIHNDQIISRLPCDEPLAQIKSIIAAIHVENEPRLPRFHGGWVGYFGYDIVRLIEPKLASCHKPDQLGMPDTLLLFSEELVVFDNLTSEIYLVVHARSDDDSAIEAAHQRLEAWMKKLTTTHLSTRPLAMDSRQETLPGIQDYRTSLTETEYHAAVERIKTYITQGDVMQVVPSQRISLPFSASPLALYRALRVLNPSPYLYFLNFKNFHVVGSSPEVLCRVKEGELTVRPIAGTRPRGKNDADDAALAEELLHDQKELAEHLMLIDLGRNDVGRVCQTGSVHVTEQMVIERYSHVMHIVSNVCGTLKPGTDPIDVLQATFPAGTLSGAPKVRAMEIIDELEPVKRGIYAGAVGYISWHGEMDTAIAIRTAIIQEGTLHIQAGGGIVADSVPELEWQETMNKRLAMFRAVAIAQQAQSGDQVETIREHDCDDSIK